MTAWWTDNFFGVWLGVGHAAIVVVLASASAWFIYHGQRQQLVTRTIMAMTAFGAACLAASLLAVAQGQHFRVWYPLMMMGGISVLTCLPNLMALDWLYRRHDARRLAAEELRRG
jgi:hypothetical protein